MVWGPALALARAGGKQLLLFLKLLRMDAAAATPQLHWMFQVQHLVVHDVLGHETRHANVIEHSADDDGVVRRIEVAEQVARGTLAP